MRLTGAILAALLVGGCGSAAATTAVLPAAAPAAPGPVILVSEGGVLRPVANGGRVPVRDAWATVRFSDLTHERIDLDVAVLDIGGRSVPASVRVSFESTDMDHGTLDAIVAARDGGYRATIDVPMPGGLRVKLRIAREGSEDTVTLILPQVGY